MLFASYKGYIHDLYWVLGIINNSPIFMELTLRCQKTPFSIFWCFRDPNDVQMTWKFMSISFWKEQRVGAKEANKRSPEGQKRWAHAAPVPGRVGPINLGLDAPLPSIFPPPTPSWPKTDYKNSPPTFSGRSAAETQKHRNRDLELQIGGGKLRRGTAGVVSIFSNDFSTVSMTKRE